MLWPNSALSRSAARPVFVLRQVRNGVSSSPSASKARKPCIIADTPSAPTPASSTPWRRRTSSARAAKLCCTPHQTASSEYVHSRSTNWFSQSWLPTASGAWSGPISTALIRVEPSSMSRAVRPSVITFPTSIVISPDTGRCPATMSALTPAPSRRPPLRRRAGAGAHQQRRGHRILVQLLAGHPGQHELDTAAAELGEVLPHRRQRRGEVRGLGQVVEADDADVPRRVQAFFVEGGEQAEGHLVVGEEDRGDVVAVTHPVGQLLARGIARRRRPVPAQDGRHRRTSRGE